MKDHSPSRHPAAETAHESKLHNVSRDVSNAHQTTVIVYDYEEWTREYRDFVRFSWLMQQQALGAGLGDKGFDLSRELQLVVFHPQATHHTCASIYNLYRFCAFNDTHYVGTAMARRHLLILLFVHRILRCMYDHVVSSSGCGGGSVCGGCDDDNHDDAAAVAAASAADDDDDDDDDDHSIVAKAIIISLLRLFSNAMAPP